MANKFSKIVADFSTSLATKVAVGGTSATLQSATDDDSVALPAGQYFFTVDGSSSNKEYWMCTLSGTSLTSIQNISRQGVLTSGSVREHRIGASVKITNFAHLLVINNILDGTDEDENTVKYSNLTLSGDIGFTGTNHAGLKPIQLTTAQRTALTPATTAIVYDTTLGEYYLWQGGAWVVISSGSVQPNGSETVAGKYQLSTVAEQGSATSAGSTGARLVPANSNLVKTSSGAGDENKIAVLNASGSFADGFLNAATTGASKTVKSKANSKIDEALLQVTDAQAAILVGGVASDADALHNHPSLVRGFNGSFSTMGTSAFAGSAEVVGFYDAATPVINISGYRAITNGPRVHGMYKVATDYGVQPYIFDIDTANTNGSSGGISGAVWNGTTDEQWVSYSDNNLSRGGSGGTFASGTENGPLGFDATSNHVLMLTSTTNIRRFSISGTQLTQVSNITLDTAVTETGFLFDDTNDRFICVDKTNNLLRRFNSTGTTVDTVAFTVDDTRVRGVVFLGNRVYLVATSSGGSQTDSGETLSSTVNWDFIPTNMTR